MSYLQNINRLNRDNLGGILEIQVARKSDIEKLPRQIKGVIYEDIIFKAGRGFYTWIATYSSISFKASDKDSNEGAYKDNKLNFQVPVDQPGLLDMFLKAQDDEFIILYRDANNKRKLLGTLDAPMRFSFDTETGSRTSAKNGYECQFFCEAPNAAAFYEAGVTPAPGGVLPALVKRGDGVIVAVLYPGDTFIVNSPYAWGYNIV